MSAPAIVPKHVDINSKLIVQYCIPLWLRDEQIKQAISRIKKRIQPGLITDEPVAVVCFGPSLADTWEQVKDFKNIITCSGAHKFLIDRGIIPTWHVEVDPRAHKVTLLGSPHSDVKYLISSTCHPKYFDHLEGFDVALWHVFDGQAEALRVLPPNEWALTGGSSAGLRSMTIARFLGFTNIHIFGMDGCEGKTGKHADAHPNQAPGHCITEYNGKEFRTTTAILECAKQTFHEIDELKDITVQFYGEGLVQEMAKDYKPKRKDGASFIGINKPELISPEYRELNAKLHADNLAYGVGGGKHAPMVVKLVETLKTSSVLDYGCGKSYLAKALPFPIWEYDPAIPTKAEPPRPADIVVCTDVLEHIEPEHLMAVLNDLKRCVLKIGYFVIHTGESTKLLADGRNAHLIQRNEKWWNKKLGAYFTVGKITKFGPLLHVIVGPKVKGK